MNKTDQLIAERQSTHGNIQSNANLLYILNSITKYDDSQVIQDTCMRMVNLKIARFISSGFKVKDSIDDALGYLKLGGDLSLNTVPELSVFKYLEMMGLYANPNPINGVIVELYLRNFKAAEKALTKIQGQADELGLV